MDRHHRRANTPTLWFAGLISQWHDLLTCTILTRAANDSVEPIHDRMPVVLDTNEREAWLGGSDDLSLGAEARVRHHPVRRFGIGDEGAELLEPDLNGWRSALRGCRNG